MKMKKLILTLAVLIAAGTSQATLIDETPGGFNVDDINLPPAWFEAISRKHLAGGNVRDGDFVWSPFEPYGPNEFSVTLLGDLTGAMISWNVPQPLLYVLVEGVGGTDHIYSTVSTERLNGSATVTINDRTNIQAVLFISPERFVFPVDEAGTGAVLLVLGLASILGFRLWSR
jgi:hypothetical protein